EAQQKLRDLQNKMGVGTEEAPDITVASYLTRWLESVKATVESLTYIPYERDVRLYLKPHIGHYKLAKLSPLAVQKLYADLAAAGVSPAMQRKAGTTLGVALRAAIRLHLIQSNPAAAVTKPKAKKKEMRVLNPEQLRA